MENKIFTLHKTVTEADTAAHVGSGSLPVLATPVLIAWVEAAACGCCAGLMEEGTTSVGTEMNMRHTAASPVGMKVTVTAELTAVEGRILSFKVYHTQRLIFHQNFLQRRRGQPYPCHYTGGALYGKGQCQAGPVREFP